MDIAQFDQAAKDFRSYADSLMERAKDDIRQARNALTALEPLEDVPSNEAVAALCLGRLSEGIEDLMRAHDKLHEIIGLPARYRPFFDLLNLTPLGWEELRRVLAEHAERPGQQ